MKQIVISVQGQVQGVFFRQSVKDFCDQKAVKGYAANLENGSVEVVAQGSQEQLYDVLEFCQQGPGSSTVSKLSFEYVPIEEEYEEFSVM